jgi:hypothetical protein
MQMVFFRAIEFGTKSERHTRIEVDTVCPPRCGLTDDHRAAIATEASVARLSNRLDHERGNRSIDGIATASKHVSAGRSRVWIGRGNGGVTGWGRMEFSR